MKKPIKKRKSYFTCVRSEIIFDAQKCPSCGVKAYGEHDNEESCGGLCLSCGYCWNKDEGQLGLMDMVEMRNMWGYKGPDNYL